jgi:hypothetical protein
MSDGPHRSLSMGRRWKKLAEYLDNDNFSADEVSERRDAAIIGEFQREVTDALAFRLRQILCDPDQGLLFRPSSDDIESLRSIASGPVAGLLIDCVIDAVESGYSNESALVNGYESAAIEIYDRNGRGMSEHYQRESSSKRASHLQSRIDSARDLQGLKSVARQLADRSRSTPVRTPSKRSGLDEGISLR